MTGRKLPHSAIRGGWDGEGWRAGWGLVVSAGGAGQIAQRRSVECRQAQSMGVPCVVWLRDWWGSLRGSEGGTQTRRPRTR